MKTQSEFTHVLVLVFKHEVRQISLCYDSAHMTEHRGGVSPTSSVTTFSSAEHMRPLTSIARVGGGSGSACQGMRLRGQTYGECGREEGEASRPRLS